MCLIQLGISQDYSAYKLNNGLPTDNRWRREWQPTPEFLAGESHGQRSLAAYNPWGHKELDTTEQLTHTDDKRREDERGGEEWIYKTC